MFGRRKSKPANKPGNDKVAMGLANLILKIQNRWADWMTRMSEKLSTRAKWVILSCAIVCVSAFSVASILGYFKDYNPKTMSADLQVPRMEQPSVPAPGVPTHDPVYQRIQLYRKYLDSLGKSESGTRLLDSLNQQRPGLIDSIKKLELIYQSKFKHYRYE